MKIAVKGQLVLNYSKTTPENQPDKTYAENTFTGLVINILRLTDQIRAVISGEILSGSARLLYCSEHVVSR